jgi:sugar phosphate isomerase/epimerase
MIFGISEFTTWPWSFERDVERYAAHGIEAIEVCEFKLDRNDYAPQLESISHAGLRVSSVQATVHSLFPDTLAPEPRAVDDRVRHIEESIDRIAPYVSEGTPFIVITGAAPHGNEQLVYEEALKNLPRLAEHARKHGMRIALESLNPSLLNTDTAIWGLDEGLELVQRIDHPALGLCLDTWNVFRTPNLEQVIEACAGRILIVQMSDWRRPRSHADRFGLGDGCIDHRSILRAIRETGYDGAYVLELLSSESLPGSLWRSDLDALIQRNIGAFDELMSRVRA